MIATKPEFIKGDHLDLKTYLASLLANKQPLYSSFWIWWKKNTLFWFLPLGVTALLLFCVLTFLQNGTEQQMAWPLIIALSFLPFIVGYPLLWLGSYYYSFVSPRKITQKIEAFIKVYLPEAEKVRHIAHNNYVLFWNGEEYEIAYSLVPCKTSSGKIVRYREALVIAMFYMPDPKKKDEILDGHGQLREELLEEWNAYCEGKDSCRGLTLDVNAIYLLRPINQLGSKEQIMNSMEQMSYLANRFGLLSLHMDFSIADAIQSWLKMIDEPTPDDIVALNIGIFDTEEGYSISLIGSKTYDENDDDWACNRDFIPVEEYFTFPTVGLSDDDWEKVLALVKQVVQDYISDKMENEHSLFYHKIVTVGFDDGNLFRIN